MPRNEQCFLLGGGLSGQRTAMSALRGKADMPNGQREVAYDPGCVKTLEAIVGAQQRNRSHSLDESFMRGRPSLCTNLVPERPIEWFSHSQDPKRSLTRSKG